MNKKYLITIIIIAVLAIAFTGLLIFWNIQNNISNTSETENETENEADTVIIKNGKIENEILIDMFIDKAVTINAENLKLKIIQDNKRINVTYTPGEYAKEYQLKKEKNEDTNIIPANADSPESRKQIYGYFTLIVDNEVKGEYSLYSYTIKRSTSDNVVTLFFDGPLIEHTEIPEICKYDLNSSNYVKHFYLSYNQRKDLDVKNVYDGDEFSVKTFGGDVQITIDNDMVYKLEDALNQKVILPNDLLMQFEIDARYGICELRYYIDGGSREFMYSMDSDNNYTVLKLNTTKGEKDLVIGMSGTIMDSYKEKK